MFLVTSVDYAAALYILSK